MKSFLNLQIFLKWFKSKASVLFIIVFFTITSSATNNKQK